MKSIETLEHEVEQADAEIDKWLRAKGWRNTSEVGTLWLWTRKLPDGSSIYVARSTAIHLQKTHQHAFTIFGNGKG